MDNQLYNAFIKYYNTLEKFGHLSYNKVYLLIALYFLKNILEVDMASSITEEYRRILDNFYIHNNCLIDRMEDSVEVEYSGALI